MRRVKRPFLYRRFGSAACIMPAPREIPELEERLEEHVDAVLSSRRTVRQPAELPARCSREEQDFVLRRVGLVC